MPEFEVAFHLWKTNSLCVVLEMEVRGNIEIRIK